MATERWRKLPDKTVPLGDSVLVWEAKNRNQWLAWFDGKRWFSWTMDGEERLNFRPTYWRPLPADPRKRGKGA
jgi:hypothetical protein